MKKSFTIWFVVAIALGVAVESWWLHHRKPAPPTSPAESPPTPPAASAAPTKPSRPPTAPAPARATPPEMSPASSAAERMAHVAQIKKDYEEMMTKFAAEFSVEGKDFPGGLNGYLRQLALLEREKWKDIAAIVSPRELEDLQMQDTHAGKEVQRLLGDTAAAGGARRAVFRVQAEFDDKWALTFDPAPATLLARQSDWLAAEEKILGLLGPDLFGAWLRGDGFDVAQASTWGAQHGAGPEFALNQWRLQNEFVLARLQISAQGLPPDEAQAKLTALVEHMHERAVAVFGSVVVEAAQAGGRNLWVRSAESR